MAEKNGDDGKTSHDNEIRGRLPFSSFLIPFPSFPTFLIGNPEFFPMQGHTKERTKEKDPGFPLKTCGNDRGRKRACLPPTVVIGGQRGNKRV